MKGLYKRGKTYWIAIKSNGKLYRESTETTSLDDAEHFLTSRRRQIRKGEKIEAKKHKNIRFAELAKDYLECCVGQKAYHSKKLLVNQLIKRFGNLKVRELDTLMVEKWQKSEQLKGNKPATVNRKLTVLKHMINKGTDWEMATEDTLKRVRKVKQLREENTRLRFLPVEECHTLIDCCSDHLKPIVTVALHTGMRSSEVLNLKWEQVDLKHGFILLDITKNGERREIPIDKTLEEMFNSMPRGFESKYVFAGKDGGPYKSVKRSFSTALKKAGIHDFRFHDLRHTFSSHLVMAGVDLTSVKELLGHKSLAMTIRYAHLSPGHKRKAIDILDKVLKSSQKEGPVHNFGSQFEDCASNSKIISHKSLYNNKAPVAQKDRATVS